MRVRPSQVADVLKSILGVRRIEAHVDGGACLLIDPASVFGSAIRHEGTYELTMTAIVKTLLHAGDVYVDVGANEGYFAVCAGRCGAEVHAFEPQSRLRQIFQDNIEINGIASRVHFYPEALTDSVGSASLFLRPTTNSGASSMIRHWKLGSTKETVATTTFDAFAATLKNRIRLVKIDCEGAEEGVIRDARQTIARREIDHIALEYHPTIIGPERCAAIDRLLHDFGYVLTRIRDTSLYSLPEKTQDLVALAHSAA